MTIGRTFLLWLLGVLVAILVLVSALVLWHERRILEQEMRNQAQLLARTLAVAAAQGGSPEFLAVVSMGDLRSGEVRNSDGGLLWRYGPSLEEVAALEPSLLKVEERIRLGSGPSTPGDAVDVVLLLSRARMDRYLAVSAVRLVTALGLALALALLVGMDLVGRVVRPLRALADKVRSFQAEEPVEPLTVEAHTVEVRDLAMAFGEMAVRLADQRRSLAASEQRFRDLFTSSPTPLLELDESLRIRGANPAAATFLGCDPSEATGRQVASFLVGIRDEDLANAVIAARTGLEAVVEARWQLVGGERAEVELHLRPAEDQQEPGSLMAIHDLTDRVRRLGERWRRTFDAMVDGVALVDPSGVIVITNQALTRDLDEIHPLIEEQLVTGEEGEWRVRSQERLLQCSLASPPGLGHRILVVRDVTEEVRSQSRLREAEKMQAVGTLASGVAHDFNNLLAAILLHVRWLLRDPDAATEAGQAIRDLAHEGIEVVRELLLFARRESTPPRTFDLGALVAAQQGLLSHLMPDGVDLQIDVEPGPVPIVGNPVAVRRLLLNLVLNARDAVSGEGGRVEVEVGESEEGARLEVADNGPGISPEHRDRLFEPFFSLKRQGRGAGLGLAVVYAIVNEHHGEIELESDGRTGSRFRVRLPLGSIDDLEPLEMENELARVDEGGQRVLLVHDDGREAARLVETMADAGLDVRHATSLDAAIEIAEDWSPTAVVTLEELPEGRTAPWHDRLGLPSVVLVSQPPSHRDDALAGTAVVERSAAPEKVVGALYRIGIRGVEDSGPSSE
jgi:PAS domain S-box-containing protein